jgi:transcription-repair coupling factor (superfamily II helicase)
MIDFHKKEYDVLVSTTIIESGLDIPNVNTLIVEDADKLGLAQLYQIRGRVGRTDRLAYAFLTYKKDKVLTEVAEKRLTAVKEFTELGSGFKIALRDMQIRGAGNILGPEQSGFMIQVGYDLYVQLLEEAVNELKGIEEEKPIYIDIMDELIDRFGDPPMSVRNLVLIAHIRSLASTLSVTEIKRKEMTYRANFDQSSNVSPKVIQELWDEFPNEIQMIPADSQVLMLVKMKTENIENQLIKLRQIFMKLAFEENNS